MSITPFDGFNNRFNTRVKPMNGITPFTYRDGLTYLKILEMLIDYVNTQLVADLQVNLDDIVSQLNTSIAEMQEQIVENEETFTQLLNEYTTHIQNMITNINVYARVLTPETYGAIGDGVTDDYQAFVDLFNDMNDGDTIFCRAGAVYLVSQALTLDSVDGWTWDHGTIRFDSTLNSTSGTIAALKFRGCSGFTVNGLRVECVTQTQQYNGLYLENCNDAVLNSLYVFNFRWAGVSLNGSPRITLNTCNVLQCRFGAFSNDGGVFIGGRYSSEWSKTQEYIDKAGVWDATSNYYDGLIFIGANDWLVSGITADDNGQSGIYAGANCHRGTVQGCSIFDNWNKGVDFGVPGAKTETNRLSHLAVTGNVFRDNHTGDIHFANVDDSTIVGNVVNRTLASPLSSSIILNGESTRNTIIGNSGDVTARPSGGVFINNDTGSVDNIVWNNINSVNEPKINVVNNTVLSSFDGFKISSPLRRGNVIDLTEIGNTTEGREILRGVGTVGSYYQITINKELRIQNALGVYQDFISNAITAQNGLTVSGGIAYFANTVTLRLPQTTNTVNGSVWYNPETGRIYWRDGVSNSVRSASYVETRSNSTLNSVGSDVNTVGKYLGKQVFNIDSNRPVWATGVTPGAVWVYSDGSTAHTPV